MIPRGSFLVLAALVAASSSACVPPSGPARRPVATSLAIAPARGAQPAEADAVRAPAPLEPIPFDPEALGALRDSARFPAVPLAAGEVPASLSAIALGDTARAEARGLQPVGGVRHVVLAEGQRATMDVDLRASDCVTVVVHGGLGVREVDAFLVAPAAPEGQILTREIIGGPMAIIGGRSGCFRAGRDVSTELAVVARKGAGPVLVALFVATVQ